MRALRVRGVVEDVAWPSGTIYMDIDTYRRLYRTAAINVLAVDRAAEIDREALRDLPALRTVSGAELIGRIDEQMDKSTQGLLAMRVLTLLAALVAVAGIIATAVLARRREWAVLRAMGLRNGGLFGALALETGLVMVLGGICGAIAGIVSYVGPTTGFLESQGYVIGGGISGLTIFAIVAVAVVLGTLAAALPGLADGAGASGRRALLRVSRGSTGRGAGAADQLGGHEQGEGGEGELQRPLGDLVGDDDADQDAERREDADRSAPRAGGRCRSRSGGSAPTRATITIISSEVDSASTWVRPRKIVSAGTKRTPPPTPTRPPARPPATRDQDREQLVHLRISSIAIATSRAAKR